MIRTIALGTALMIACTACGGSKPAARTTVPGEPGFLVEVNGHPLYHECAGHGSPTIVLEAGLGGDHRAWSYVMPELARTTRTCAYDRAGTGFSLPAGSNQTAQDDVDDLHGLLDRADIKGPYVLVGHSFGGILAQLYASQHPNDVAGVVLVDSSSFDQKRRYLRAIGPARPGEARIVTELRSFLTHPGRSPEGIDFNEVLSKGGSVRSIDPKPLIVISAGQETSAQAPARWRRTFDRVWLSLQSDLARLSSNSRHVIAVYSPHFVMSPLGQPELVVRGVREVVQAVRAGRRLRPCRAVFAPPAARCVG